MAKRLTVKAMREATGLSAATIRLYFDSGLIPGDVDSNGHRSFPPNAVAVAKAVHAERMAKVGRPVNYAANES
jgi:DNA-binding transcriptional MerR regulator